MRVKNFSLLFLCLIGISMLFFSTLLSNARVDNSVAAADLTNVNYLGNEMFSEERRGYSIEISRPSPSVITTADFSEEGIPEGEDGSETLILLIDGNTVPYIKTSEGYRIYYQPPEPDLPSAARSYVDTQPEQ